jgi:Stress responsive A/B Barrel Domain
VLVHIVLGKARQDLTASEQQELSAALASLGAVTGVQQMTHGPNFSERSKGYTHAAVLYFADRAALQGYQVADLHQRAVQVFDRLMPERMIVDYETETSGISA